MERKSNSRYFELFIIFLLGLHILFDVLQGVSVSLFDLNLSVSGAYKILLVIFCTTYCLCLTGNKKNSAQFTSIILCYMVMLLFVSFFRDQGDSFFYNATEIIKMMSFFIIYFTVSQFCNYEPIKATKYIIGFSLFLVVSNILLSMFGIGSNSYGDFGGKGFFYAANAISSGLLIFSTFYLTVNINNKISYFIFCALVILIGGMLGTKASVLSIIIMLFIIPLICGHYNLFLVTAVSSFFALTVIALYFSNQFYEHGLIERALFFYNSGGIERMIFSGRNEFFVSNMNEFLMKDLVSIMFGIGHSGIQNFDKPLIEMDFFDIPILFGFSTLLFYIILFCFIYLDLLSDRKRYSLKENEYLWVGTLLSGALLSMAFLSGHVIFNGITTTFWALFLSLPKWMMKYRRNMLVENI